MSLCAFPGRIAPRDLAAIGITNQRETTLVWERASGRPVHRAIVWQDRRTADACDRLKAAGHEPLISRKTGLLLDPYFSATKVAAILDATPGARARAERGELAFGTVDSFLIWRLTGGVTHVTDATNASRSMLFDIHKGEWDEELLSLFDVPKAILPRVSQSSGELGVTDPEVVRRGERSDPRRCRGPAGAMVGQACFEPGMMKSTYGTGCFALLNTGEEAVVSQNRLLTTIAYQFGTTRASTRPRSTDRAGPARALAGGEACRARAESRRHPGRLHADDRAGRAAPRVVGRSTVPADLDDRGVAPQLAHRRAVGATRSPDGRAHRLPDVRSSPRLVTEPGR